MEPVTETVVEHQGEDPHVITISATIDRVVRGFKTGEDPEHVAGILADMFPDYLEEILKYPEEACVAYIMQYSGQVPELAAEGAEEYVRAILGELRELQGEEKKRLTRKPPTKRISWTNTLSVPTN